MVYVVQVVEGRNILPAQKYGKLVALLPEGSQVTLSAGYVTNSLKSKLSNFNDNDYLLLMGDPIAIGIATAIAAHWNMGRVKLLKWDKQEKIYFPVQISIHQKGDVDGLAE